MEFVCYKKFILVVVVVEQIYTVIIIQKGFRDLVVAPFLFLSLVMPFSPGVAVVVVGMINSRSSACLTAT